MASEYCFFFSRRERLSDGSESFVADPPKAVRSVLGLLFCFFLKSSETAGT